MGGFEFVNNGKFKELLIYELLFNYSLKKQKT